MKLSRSLFAALSAFSAAHAETSVAPPTGPAGAAPVAVVAAPLMRDLGRNLVYHRVRRLPDDLPVTDRKQARVLDLRYVRADPAATVALHTWIKAHVGPRAPIFVLANSGTDRDLIAPLIGRGAADSVVVIGRAARGFNPDIAVEITADAERRAYDAFEAGTELGLLLTENSDKIRNDEASLSRDRSSEPSPATAPGPARPEAPPIDAALQRAVHLHRTLVALRKI